MEALEERFEYGAFAPGRVMDPCRFPEETGFGETFSRRWNQKTSNGLKALAAARIKV
jgi:hypothetical protein